MEDIIFISQEKASFYKTSGGFLGLRFEDKEHGRVSLQRAFPFSYSDEYISVRDKEGKEIGIIKQLNEFPKDVAELFMEELNRRYLLPKINKISSLKQEFGYCYWNVTTEIGPKRFTTKKDNSSFINIKDNRILIVDVDGNRFEISDYTKLDLRSYKQIELLL